MPITIDYWLAPQSPVPQRMAATMLDAQMPGGIARDASGGVHADGFVTRRQAAHEHG